MTPQDSSNTRTDMPTTAAWQRWLLATAIVLEVAWVALLGVLSVVR